MNESFDKIDRSVFKPEDDQTESLQTEEHDKPVGERTLYGKLDISEPINNVENSADNELPSSESEVEQNEQTSEIFSPENEESQSEDPKDEIAKLESEVAQAERALEAAYAENEAPAMETSTNEMENPELSPEFQTYVEEMKTRMKEEFEGMNFDPETEAEEKPKRTALKKAMLIATAGVMLWMTSAAAAPDTAEGKSGIRLENIFDSKATAKKLEKQRQRELRKFEKSVEKSGRIIVKSTQKGISKAVNNSVNEILNNIFK